MNQILSNKIKQALLQADKVSVIGHKEPDGDALGSATALIEYLQQNNKQTTLFCATPADHTFDFLPHMQSYSSDESILIDFSPDVIVVVDSGSLPYAGIDHILQQINHDYTLINIDHHQSNTMFGDLNLLMPQASSTCEIVYQLLRSWQFPINQRIATSLLNGILTDTGGLTNPATTDDTLAIAAKLMKFGANYKKIQEYNVRNKRPQILRLWGLAMQRLIYNPQFKSAATYLTQQDFTKLNMNEDDLSGLANFLSSLEKTRFTMLLVESADNTIKGSLRTTRNDVNVGALAKELGGGGHRKAAGFVVLGKMIVHNSKPRIV